MFCPSCGAQNPDDARFCNMCGTALTAPSANTTMRGAGPHATPPAASATASRTAGREPTRGPFGYAPQSDESGASSVSLSAIGVQSTGRVWATIAGGAAVLLALGALGGWLATRGSGPAAEVPPDAVAAPMEIGLPTAVDEHAEAGGATPDAVAPTESTRGERGARAETTRTAGRERSAESARNGVAARGGSGGAQAAGREGRTAGAVSPNGAGTAGASGAANPGQEAADARPTSADSSGGTAAAGDSAPTGGASSDPAAADPAAGEEERDLMLDLYATRVRRYIRTYYAARAQSCFDRAARVNEGIRGTVIVAFTIKEAGGTEGARVTRNTTGDDVLATCLVNQVGQWDLPGPPGGALELSMPFSR